MAIGNILQDIMTAVYGRDVRQAIHDGIEECYNAVGPFGEKTNTMEQSLTWADGAYINAYDSVTAHVNYSYCDYVAIPPNTVACLHSYFDQSARIVVYNRSKTLIDSYSNTSGSTDKEYTITIPVSGSYRYVRMSCLTDSKDSAFVTIQSDPRKQPVAEFGDRISTGSQDLLDCDDATMNTIYTITNDTVLNVPSGETYGVLITFQGATSMGPNGNSQLFITRFGRGYVRSLWDNNWSSWRRIDGTDRAILEYGTRRDDSHTYVLTDLDDAEQNRIYTITSNSGVSNLPNDKIGTLMTFNGASSFDNAHTQIFVDRDGYIYSRIRWNDGWLPWHSVNTLVSDGEFSGVEVFERFGVIGDSFASGTVYKDSSYTDHMSISWPQILSRMSGNIGINYTKGGIYTKTWLSNTSIGMQKVLDDINGGHACGLYLLCLGINDSNTSIGGGMSYLGTISDIHDNDYSLNADTFYGNYGKIVQMIQEASPDSRIIMCNYRRNPTTDTQVAYDAFREAISNIADHFSIPFINLDNDEFFMSSYYMNKMLGAHPTAPQYAGYAKAMNRLISRAMIEYYDYFKLYTGQNIVSNIYSMSLNDTTLAFENLRT